MSVRLYFDVHVPVAVADALRLRDVDVLTAQEDGAAELEDPLLLDRATELRDRLRRTRRRCRPQKKTIVQRKPRLLQASSLYR